MTEKKMQRLTGVAVPLGALKSKESVCAGEFLDLIPFADFCRKSGLKIIQLLPVNDTGTESSPYSALSAFALHPIYIRLSEVKGYDFVKTEVEAYKEENRDCKRYSYSDVRKAKTAFLKTIYENTFEEIMTDKELQSWIKKNPWSKEYSVFMYLKNQNMEASWKEWKKFRKITAEKIDELWKDKSLKKDILFHAWVQMNLDIQFQKAADYLKKQKIILKGDIPIMMNEDSVDTWAYGEYFDDSLRAGSPPDDSNPYGQNWGFPVYNWKKLKKDDYSWWKERLKHASKYYRAYRIDHILGFFRIWAVPENECCAVMGHTLPLETISFDELKSLGFDENRIRWLSKPHVRTDRIQNVNNGDYLGTHGLLGRIMNRIGNEELWLFNDKIRGEKDIYASDLPDPVKCELGKLWRDRALIEVGKEKYTPLWTYYNTTSWNTLSYDEKEKLERLFASKKEKMEKDWEKQALSILSELISSVDMIPCAEDLGSNPLSVPRVLEKLNILGLKVVRWSRKWNQNGMPYERFEDYNGLSVVTTSVHDSSTLRGWWKEENGKCDFLNNFTDNPSAYQEPNEKTVEFIMAKVAEANSMFMINPLQDFLALSDCYTCSDFNEERVNIPGSVSKFNWTYRMPVYVEDLLNDENLCRKIENIALLHDKR